MVNKHLRLGNVHFDHQFSIIKRCKDLEGEWEAIDGKIKNLPTFINDGNPNR